MTLNQLDKQSDELYKLLRKYLHAVVYVKEPTGIERNYTVKRRYSIDKGTHISIELVPYK